MSDTKTPTYELLYWPTIPGRGEFIRLIFEASGTSYVDVCNAPSSDGPKAGVKPLLDLINPKSTGDADGNLPVLAPPAIKVPGEGKDGKDLVICQTPNVVLYLAGRVGLEPEGEVERLGARQLMFAALDLTNEAHDTHHPLAVSKAYEEQKDAALMKAGEFRNHRIPKFFGYFERVLKGNEGKGHGKYMVGDKLSFADTTVWQAVDGVSYAFPKEVEARKGEFPLLFTKFVPSVREERGLKEYLASDRRKPYSHGIFRHYPELDRQ
jgi:glutathione S-transferase